MSAEYSAMYAVAVAVIHCDGCDDSCPHEIAEATDGAISFLCRQCGATTTCSDLTVA